MGRENRNTYISNMDLEKAQELFFERIPAPGNNHEKISILGSVGRITYTSCYSKICSPFYNASAMDGIAVYSKQTETASDGIPLRLTEGIDFEYIDTGDPIDDKYDAVIMIEDVINIDDNNIEIIKPAYPWQYIRPIGEDIIMGDMILPQNHKIRAVDLGALISGGIEEISVYKKPKVCIIPTGTELVDSLGKMEKGKIMESNSRVIEHLIIEYGGLPNRVEPIPDDYEKLKSAFLEGITHSDILIVNAGTSAGVEDYTVKIIKELGEVLVHGIGIRPGKPVILGLISNKPVIGLPGYPVSSYITFEIFVKPLIYNYLGIKMDEINTVSAIMSKRIVSSFKYKEFIRVGLGFINGKLIATPLDRSAGSTTSLVKADGIMEIPRELEGIESGDEVTIRLLKPLDKIKDSLVSLGSHDLIMDIISDMMNLKSEHVGSMGGIMALRRNNSHLAPIHLLDEKTGLYNISYIKKYFPKRKMALVKGVKRMQGFIVEKGNPLKISTFKDLEKNDIIYANRQKGSGTRLLLDYNLNKNNIDPKDISGYDREMTTHMAVAISVKSGSSNVGLGILSAAKSLGLDFVKIGYEEYDFLIPYEYLEDNRIKTFLSIIKSNEFIRRIEELGGYSTDNMGVINIIGG